MRHLSDGSVDFTTVKDGRAIDYSFEIDMRAFATKALLDRGESTKYGLRALQLHHGNNPRSGHWTLLHRGDERSFVMRSDADEPKPIAKMVALQYKTQCSTFVYARLSARLVHLRNML